MLQMQFLKSGVNPQDYPLADRPEVALLGRSNAGKSSLLNALAGRKLAHVSATPGKTRLLNFFDVDERYRIVDMPGYGFAARSGGERMSWAPMIERFVALRENLVGAVLVMDIRREWSSDEDMIWDWLNRRSLPLCVVLNKVDKLTAGAAVARSKKFRKDLPDISFFAASAVKKTGLVELEEFIFRGWIRERVQ